MTPTAQTVDQALRDEIVKAGLAFEPPKIVRPRTGPCPYVDTTNPQTGRSISIAKPFEFKGRRYQIKYTSGCFYPFIFQL